MRVRRKLGTLFIALSVFLAVGCTVTSTTHIKKAAIESVDVIDYPQSPFPSPTPHIGPVGRPSLSAYQKASLHEVRSMDGILRATVTFPPPTNGACPADLAPPSSCGFNYSGYPAAVQLRCHLTYYRPNTAWTVGGHREYFTNCATCLEGALQGATSAGGPITQATSLRCTGTPLLNEQWKTKHSFKIETLNPGSKCASVPRFFSFDSCQ